MRIVSRYPCALLAAWLLAAPLDAQINRPGGRPVGRPTVGAPPPADSAAARLAPGAKLADGASLCPAAVSKWWREHGRGGRIACAADPTRPAVLLVHGLHQDMRS